MLNVTCDEMTVSFDWGDTVHVYRKPSGDIHQTRNALANFINTLFPAQMMLRTEPVIRSTGDAYAQGVEFGWKLATNWANCGITIEQYENGDGYTAYDDSKNTTIYDGPSFTDMRVEISRYTSPEVCSTQYENDLQTLLVARNLTLQHLPTGFTFCDHNGAVVSLSDKLDVAITQALERTAK